MPETPYVTPEPYSEAGIAGWRNDDGHGHPAVSKDVRDLIRAIGRANPLWGARPANRVANLVWVDFFTVPPIRFQVLYVSLVLAHDQRRIIHFAVTHHPTAERTAKQIREAFPWDSAP